MSYETSCWDRIASSTVRKLTISLSSKRFCGITPSKEKNETKSHFSNGLVADERILRRFRHKILFGRCNVMTDMVGDWFYLLGIV